MSKRVCNKPKRAWTSGNSWAKHKVRVGKMERRVVKLALKMEAPCLSA